MCLFVRMSMIAVNRDEHILVPCISNTLAIKWCSHHRHGGDIARGSTVSLGPVLVEPPALSKVRKLGDDAFPHEYVVGLDVAVDQRLRELVVEVREAAGRAHSEAVAHVDPRAGMIDEKRAERTVEAKFEHDAQLVRTFFPHSAVQANKIRMI